jgi:hypothetical protein
MKKNGLIWSYTKGEFVVFDHYYFSILYKYLKDNYELAIPTSFNSLKKMSKKENFNTIIFNYPEKKFTQSQLDELINLFDSGKRIVFLTYYKNEDNSSSISNTFLNKLGININYDELVQDEKVYNNDKYLLIIDDIDPVLGNQVSKILIPCTSTISIKKKKDYQYKPLLKSNSNKIVTVEVQNSNNGKVLAFGSCVFWDNFSIVLYDNFQFVKNLINYLVEG